MNKNKNFLKEISKEEIMKGAPQVYTTQPAPSVSGKYTFIPTFQIIEDMQSLGWKVCQAVSMKTSNDNQAKYGKHMIKFFNPDIVINGEDGVEAYPQILIMNNHRGWGRFKFEVGIFRLVCSNGLVVKDRDFGSFVMRHLGYSFEELKSLVNQAVEKLPDVVARINQYTEIEMSVLDMKRFAEKALKIRLGEDRDVNDEEIKQVLSHTRQADAGNNLWVVFNRVQEHLTKGGFYQTTSDKKQRKVRGIKNMMKDLELNQQLWELTNEFIPA